MFKNIKRNLALSHDHIGWEPIENAPKDGLDVWVRRLVNNTNKAEGWAIFKEDRWWYPAGLFHCPEPTQWHPERTAMCRKEEDV